MAPERRLASIAWLVGYLVGDDGSVWSCLRGEPRRLRPFDRKRRDGSASPYLSVSLGRGRVHYVQRLVCEAFHGAPPFDGAQACHKNGKGHDNRADNLRWGTQEDNDADRYAHGAWSRAWETRREAHAFSDLLGGAT